MSVPTNYQILTHNGKPTFAVIPYAEHLQLMKHAEGCPDEEVMLPHEVSILSALGGEAYPRKARVFGSTQDEVARQGDITPIDLCQD